MLLYDLMQHGSQSVVAHNRGTQEQDAHDVVTQGHWYALVRRYVGTLHGPPLGLVRVTGVVFCRRRASPCSRCMVNEWTVSSITRTCEDVRSSVAVGRR